MRWPNSSDVAAFEREFADMDLTRAIDKVVEGGQLPFTRNGIGGATYWDDGAEAAWRSWWDEARERPQS